ncbi:TPA: Rha family transcriptional regulator [Klebsiella aerogenes]
MTSLSLNTNNATPFNSASISVIAPSTVQTMSSKEIADLTGKEHKHVLADIRNMFEQLNIQSADFSASYKDSLGRTYPCFNLDKELSVCLVSGYNVQLRMAIIKRWTELEAQAQQSFALPTTFSQALLLAAQLEEQKEQLALQVAQQQQVIEHQKPTVDAYEMIAGKRGSLCFQEAYKFLGGMKLKDMKQWLLDKKWIYIDRHNRLSASNIYTVNGYLVVKATTHQPQIRITYKGLAAIARQMKIKLNPEDFN